MLKYVINTYEKSEGISYVSVGIYTILHLNLTIYKSILIISLSYYTYRWIMYIQ